jgi:hypothetical protein
MAFTGGSMEIAGVAESAASTTTAATDKTATSAIMSFTF